MAGATQPAPGAHRIERHKFVPTDRLFFDANVWVYIYDPNTNPYKFSTKAYSAALKNALTAKSTIEINSMVLSEFINRCLRLEHALLVDSGIAHKDFKTYRASQEYAASVAAVAGVAQTILNHCHRIADEFDSVKVPDLLTDFGNSQSDLNDLFYIETCRRRGLTLVTEDADFKNCGIPILSHNPAFFRP